MGSEKSSKSFHRRAVQLIKNIPKGKVATYGQIAALAGSPRAARMVTRVLNTAWQKENLPWHRVVNSKGGISLKPGHGYELQKKLLKKEGITFRKDDCIDLECFLWAR